MTALNGEEGSAVNANSKTFREVAPYWEVARTPEYALSQIEFLNWVFSRAHVRSVIDVACGTGRHAVRLAKLGYEVAALDKSDSMLKEAMRFAKAEGVTVDFRQGSYQAIPFKRKFDGLMCIGSAFNYNMTIEDAIRTLAEFRRVLRKGGKVVIDMVNFLELLPHIDFRQPYSDIYERNGLVMATIIRYKLDELTGAWIHDEFGIVNARGEVQTFHDVSEFRVITYHEFKHCLAHVRGFGSAQCYGNWTDRSPAANGSRYPRLIFVISG